MTPFSKFQIRKGTANSTLTYSTLKYAVWLALPREVEMIKNKCHTQPQVPSDSENLMMGNMMEMYQIFCSYLNICRICICQVVWAHKLLIIPKIAPGTLSSLLQTSLIELELKFSICSSLVPHLPHMEAPQTKLRSKLEI